MLKRIYMLIIAVLLIAVLATGLAGIQTIRATYSNTNRSFLLSAATVARQALDEGAVPETASMRVMQAFAPYASNLRLTLINSQGEVLFDSEADASQMENHLFRPEISYALAHQEPGSAIRKSSTLNADMLYIAIYDADLDIVIRTAMSMAAYTASLNSLLTAVLIVMAISLVILALAGYVLTRLITLPIINLQQAASTMAKGDYSVRIGLSDTRSSEVRSLAQAFNSMADKLEQTISDLQDKNARLDVIFNSMSDPLVVVTPDQTVTFMNRPAREIFGRDLDPAKATFPLLLITHCQSTDNLTVEALSAGRPIAADCPIQTSAGNRIYHIIASPIKSSVSEGAILTFHDVSEAVRVQKMRSDFVANVTHELRTPLTSIRGFIDTLRQGAISKPEVADRFLQIIDIEADRLHKLISDILILSEIEDLPQDRDFETFDLNELIDDVTVLLDETAAEKRVSIIADTDGTPLIVQANRFRMKQILINLTENAIKYNYPEGKVYIAAERLPSSQVRLTVRDTGPGISREHQDRVFERFYRIDTSRSRELGGTGLGLAIVKHIAQLYGGTARVVSEPGQGATFIVDLMI